MTRPSSKGSRVSLARTVREAPCPISTTNGDTNVLWRSMAMSAISRLDRVGQAAANPPEPAKAVLKYAPDHLITETAVLRVFRHGSMLETYVYGRS